MRVIAGSRRSLPLRTLPGNDTRPTTDRIKETLFNILSPYLSGCRFLDVFAGSGGIGIEALSRGASHACFVEKNPKATAVIRENLAFTRFTDEAKVITGDAVKVFSRPNRDLPYDLIFMDPPYALGVEESVLSALMRSGGWLRKDGLVVVEADQKTGFSWTESLGLSVVREKCYKTNKHVFIRPDRPKNQPE